MRNAAITMLHDVAMLLVIVALGSWRFTGVPWHEYLSIALAGAVFVHLLRQRSWIVSNASRLGALPNWRARVNVVLNILMFVTLVSVTASGLFASKVVWIHTAMPASVFIRWHEVHGYTGTWLQWLAALHIAVNWVPIVKRARVIAGAGRADTRRSGGRPLSVGARSLAVFGLWILAASAVVTGLTMTVHRLVPDMGSITIDRADGRGEQPATRAEIVGLRPGQESANVDGFQRFAMGVLVTGVAAALGRVVLRLRL
jgi:hypothetical protein